MVIKNREPRRDRSTGRVYIHIDLTLGILGLKEEKLRRNEVRDLVVDLTAEEDDAILQQPRVNVVGALTAPGLLDHEWNEDAHGLRILRAGDAVEISMVGSV